SKGHNPKGIGLFLWSFAKLYSIDPKDDYLDRINYLLDLLEKYKSPGISGNGWGYNFPWQSRAFFLPRYTPTIVNSCFIGHALLDTHRITGIERAIDLAMPIRDFITKDLNRTDDGDAFCFSYTPIDKLIVHNANFLGASLLIRLNDIDGSNELKATALASLAYSMRRQMSDGSWWYADTNYQQWIDSFHTGFNLQCIEYFMNSSVGPEVSTTYRDQFERGLRFYADNFFLADGTPKYFHDRLYPIDIHSFAQAIVFFSHHRDDYNDLLQRIVQRLLDTFMDPGGYSYFQQKERRVIKIPYMRWAQAWTLHALTEYLSTSATTESKHVDV
ncbi:MAG: hypothetical protein WBD31_18260, partial [Rubripirellula sp.]